MSGTNDGQWRILHPCELIATFLLPLPDPLPVKDATVLPVYRPMDHGAMQVLQPWLGEFWLQRLDQPDIVPLSEMFDLEGEDKVPVIMFNKFSLVTSVQFHQVFSDAELRLGLQSAMRLAEAVSGPPLTAEEKMRVLDRGFDGYVDFSALREMGLGAVTVAECVVGLRIVGDLPKVESPLVSKETSEEPFGPTESDNIYPDDGALWNWRFFPSGSDPDHRLVERRLRNALNIVLKELRSIQRAIHSVRRGPMMMARLERLPFIVPVVLRLAGDIGDARKDPTVVLFATDLNPGPVLAPATLTDEESAAFQVARRRSDGGAFAAHVDVHREAHVALKRLGDHRLAALLLGISAESLFDELILHLMWEEGLTPEDAARGWIDGLDTRVKRELPHRLGGSWDVTGRSPIGVWAQDVALLRHRVAHAAYTPTGEEARRSFDAVSALVSHLCDRLAKPEVMRTYPRTALTLAGESGLRSRNSYTRKLADLQNDESEVQWIETFYRWREAWRRTRQDLTAKPRVPLEEASCLLAICHPDGSLRWIRHDRAQHLAIEVDIDENHLMPGFIEHVYAAAEDQRGKGNPIPISTAHLAEMPTTYRPGALWVEDYHHVPMAEVMVDWSDYRQQTDIGISPT